MRPRDDPDSCSPFSRHALILFAVILREVGRSTLICDRGMVFPVSIDAVSHYNTNPSRSGRLGACHAKDSQRVRREWK
jgi:hypothetical protein